MWITAVIANLPELIMWIGSLGIAIYTGRRYERWLWGLPTPVVSRPWARNKNVIRLHDHVNEGV